MSAGVINESNQYVTLRRLDLNEGPGHGTVARVADVTLAVDRTGPDIVTLSTYGTYPPVERVGRKSGKPRCLVQKVKPLEGYRLAPGEEVKFLIRVRADAPRRMKVESETIVYERDGETFEQKVPYGIIVLAVDTDRKLSLYPEEAACAHLAEVLPGWKFPRR